MFNGFLANITETYRLLSGRGKDFVVMRPSSLGGGRLMRRTLSVRLSVRPSRYRY